MINSNCHTHTIFCDGKNTPEEMVKAAINLGFKSLGFSVHCPMNFKNDYECSPDKLPIYIETINNLKEKYKNQIEILQGVELDADHIDLDMSQYEYVIGAVHQLHCNGNDYYIDFSADYLTNVVNKEFNGSWLDMAKQYYSNLAEFICKEKTDVVAHYDLVEKFNDQNELFNSECDEYKLIVKIYLEKICYSCPDIIFEVNTGAMYRCGNHIPYPSPYIMKLLKSHDMKLTVSSDAHCTDALNFKFSEMMEYCKTFGFNEIYLLENGRFCPVTI